MEIIVPIGISGSGKSRLYKMRYSHLTLVNTDLICKEVTGDINDYSRPVDVFNEIDRRIDELTEKKESFFFDNTNLLKPIRKILTDRYRGTDVKITYVVLPADIEVSMKRIEEDFKNNVERGRVSNISFKIQMYMYNESLNKKFEGENVQEIIYLKPEDLD